LEKKTVGDFWYVLPKYCGVALAQNA